jgi:hypothetical protein
MTSRPHDRIGKSIIANAIGLIIILANASDTANAKLTKLISVGRSGVPSSRSPFRGSGSVRIIIFTGRPLPVTTRRTQIHIAHVRNGAVGVINRRWPF